MAAGRKPPLSSRRMTSPMRSFETPSGLMMVKVRSMQAPLLFCFCLSGARSQGLGHRLSDESGILHNPDAGSLQRANLLRRRAAASRDDGPGVPHPLARRSRPSSDERHDRDREVLLDVIGGGLFGGSSDLP